MRNILTTLLAVVAGAGLAHAIDVTLCDQVVPAGQIGDVQNDLDCQSNAFAAAVHLEQNARLRLNGHRIIGPKGGANVIDIPLSGRIEGPGEIAGAADSAFGSCVSADGSMLRIDGGDDGIDIHGCNAGVVAVNGKAQLTDVRLHDNVGPGAFAPRLTATDVSSTDNGAQGLNSDKLKATNVIASRNRLFGLGGKRVLVLGGTLADNGRFGISTLDGRVTAKSVTITGSGEVGVLGGGKTKIMLKDSTVTGTGPGTGTFPPNTDVYAAVKRPTVVHTVCGKSAGGPAGTWDVCQND